MSTWVRIVAIIKQASGSVINHNLILTTNLAIKQTAKVAYVTAGRAAAPARKTNFFF